MIPPEKSLSMLLRLKRYEQPPPGYFDDFLREFQARQRTELIRRPVWAIFMDRVSAMAPSFRVPALAYAGLLVLALGSAGLILTRPDTGASRLAAGGQMSLVSPEPVTIGESLPVVLTSTGGSPSIHYVLPSRPVGYARARSF